MTNIIKLIKKSNLLKLLIIIALALTVLGYIFNILIYVNNYLTSNLDINILHMNMSDNSSSSNTIRDPVRWWPTGVAQTWTVLGSALALYRFVPGSQRTKILSALGSLTISVPMIVLNQAVENPNGFNQLMYSWSERQRTGQWPSHIPNNVSDKQLDFILEKVAEESKKVEVVNQENINISDISNKFTDNIDINNIVDRIINELSFIKPNHVEGYFDDLIGQQLFIQFLLLSIVIGLIILFTIFLFINMFLLNKEYILSKFDNKLIKFYIKYQVLLSKISFILLPIFILLGLIQLFIGLWFIITHPIPYEELGIDLHKFISSK